MNYNDENIKINKLLLDKKILNLIKTNKLNFHNLNKKNNDMCSICLQSDVSMITTECKHMFCVSCYLNHLAINIKENKEINCCFCRRNLSSKQINLENLDIFKNIENMIKTNIKYHILYFSDQIDTNLENNNLSNILSYFVSKNKGKFTFIKKIDELLKIGFTSKQTDNILLCYNVKNIDRIYNSGFTNIIKIIEN